MRQLGELGAHKAVRLIMGREPELTKTTLGCELVVRESCGAGTGSIDAESARREAKSQGWAGGVQQDMERA